MVRYGDAIEGLLGLDAESVSLVCSDLPSGETQAEFDRPPDLKKLWPAIWRVLKPNGVIVLMASSLRFAAELIASDTSYRYDLVWRKSIMTGHLNASKRPLRGHEFLLVFFRGHPTTYNAQMIEGSAPIHAARRGHGGQNYGKYTRVTYSRAGATDRFPNSVLDFASVGTTSKTRVHPQQKPVELLRWVVRTYSNQGDLVVDPYAGSGSCAEACRLEGRYFVGWDSSPRFGRVV